MADPHKGPALQLIHEQPDRPWTLGELGRRVGLGRSTFSARFTKLIGQPMHRYLIARRRRRPRFCSKPATRVSHGWQPVSATETAAAFSKLFHRYHGLSPGR